MRFMLTHTPPPPPQDEVFHIPQAQVYCKGAFSQWDDKITTPPGLSVPSSHLYSGLANRTLRYYLALAWLRSLGLDCSPASLRAFNTVVIAVLSCLAVACRASIEGGSGAVSLHALHTGLNIGLFPVLFFFSGLYYTDVLSTCVVLGAYLHHLHRVNNAHGPSLASDVCTVLWGISTLFMRQTNVFWVVPFLGGLEAVAALKALKPPTPRQPQFETLASQLGYFVRLYSTGHIHDPAVDQAEPQDLALVVISLAIAALCNLPTVLRRVCPHLGVAALFAGFVYWNGGVVLGDKSNHVATLHLAQMLYLWPLMSFFSAPLFLPQVERVFELLTSRTPSGSPSSKGEKTQGNSSKRSPANLKAPGNTQQQSLALTAFNRVFTHGPLLSTILVGACFAAGLAVVHWNTIVHPFTLADNRHYMFYVFRYTIRRHPAVRHALVPAYLVCGYLAWAALYGRRRPSSSSSSPRRLDTPANAAPPASTVLILIITTAASLVTAPLVEPRYFILPWVFWRLLVPSSSSPSSSASTGRFRAMEPRLVAETLWFALVNLGTMYIFLTRPFLWRAADGSLLDEGKQQRFMW